MNEMTSDIINFCQMLLPRWGEFMLCATLPRAVPTADGFLPFQRTGGCEAWRVGMSVTLIGGAMGMLMLGSVGVKKALLHAIIKRKKLRLSFF